MYDRKSRKLKAYKTYDWKCMIENVQANDVTVKTYKTYDRKTRSEDVIGNIVRLKDNTENMYNET